MSNVTGHTSPGRTGQGSVMKIGALLAVIAAFIAAHYAGALAPAESMLSIAGLSGLALLTHRSERWTPARRA